MTNAANLTAPTIAADLPKGFRQAMMRLIRKARKLETTRFDEAPAVGRFMDSTYSAVDRHRNKLPASSIAVPGSYEAQQATIAAMDDAAQSVRDFARQCRDLNDAARRERLAAESRELRILANREAYQRREMGIGL